MANINVSYEEIDNAASRLRTGQEEVAGKLDSLQKDIQTLVSSGFVTDSASGAFEATYNEFTGSAKVTVGTLNELAEFLSKTAEALKQTDADIAAAARR